MDSINKPRRSILAMLMRVYIVIGTSLFFLLFRFEQLIARLGNNTGAPILDTFTPEKWQVKSVRHTLAFPFVFVIILISDLLLLIYALIWAGLRLIASLVRGVVSSTVRASKPAADRSASTVQTIWEETTQSADESLPVNLPDIQDVRETVAETGERVRETVAETGERVRETLGTVGERLGSAATVVGERASEVIDAARGRTGDAVEDSDVATAVKSDQEIARSQEGEATSSAARVAINRATLEQLTALPGIGEALAQRIVDYRQANGPFADMNALTAVSGVGSSLLEKIDGLVVFD
jgi:competence ComEA-like helix-hairpin-helix protein